MDGRGPAGGLNTSLFCLHVFALHDRRAVFVVNCARCTRKIARFAAGVMKCTKCRFKIHASCLKPSDLVKLADGTQAPLGSSRGGGLLAEAPASPLPSPGKKFFSDDGGAGLPGSPETVGSGGAGGSPASTPGSGGARGRRASAKKGSPLRPPWFRKKKGEDGSPAQGDSPVPVGADGSPITRESYEPVDDGGGPMSGHASGAHDSPLSAVTVSTHGTGTPSPARRGAPTRPSERSMRALRKAQSFAGPERAGAAMLSRADSMGPELRQMYLQEVLASGGDDKWPTKDVPTPMRARSFGRKMHVPSKLALSALEEEGVRPGGALLSSTPGRGLLSRGDAPPALGVDDVSVRGIYQRRASLPEPATVRAVLAAQGGAPPLPEAHHTGAGAGTPPRGVVAGEVGHHEAAGASMGASSLLPGGRLAAAAAGAARSLRHSASAPAASMFAGRMEDIIRSERNARAEANVKWPANIQRRARKVAHRPSPLRKDSTDSLKSAGSFNSTGGGGAAAGGAGGGGGLSGLRPDGLSLGVDTGARSGMPKENMADMRRSMYNRRSSAPISAAAMNRMYRRVLSASSEDESPDEAFPDADTAARMKRRSLEPVPSPTSPLSQEATSHVLLSSGDGSGSADGDDEADDDARDGAHGGGD
mmetsp:Transcript_27959/g.96626  ORF Transcript_27959/g.96626 Transcript_27959/m.96626 type:complete len:647 (-) Transcript_27959:301-2241(-)